MTFIHEPSSPKGWYQPRHLPHFDDKHVIQSITFRLYDSLPQELQKQLQEWKRISGQFTAKQRKQIEENLDSGYGECYLQKPDVALLVQNTLLHFHHERYTLIAWVIMPNHVHVMLQLHENYTLSQLMLSIKGFTARHANKLLGRTGHFWQRDYFDRFIRDEHHLNNVVGYIHQNPVKAGLVRKANEWEWSSVSWQG